MPLSKAELVWLHVFMEKLKDGNSQASAALHADWALAQFQQRFV